jgi:hypothetical protein
VSFSIFYDWIEKSINWKKTETPEDRFGLIVGLSGLTLAASFLKYLLMSGRFDVILSSASPPGTLENPVLYNERDSRTTHRKLRWTT